MMALPLLPQAWALSDLLSGFATLPFESAVRIERLTLHSRNAGPAALFLACRGGRRHGLCYAEQAAERGCAAIVAEPDQQWGQNELARLAAELSLPVIPVANLSQRAGEIAARFHGDPSAGMEVFGVTGTNGKTSVSHFVAQALAPELGCGVLGTLGSGFPGDLSPSNLTTPDPLRLQATFATLKGRGADAVAMEVSSHALDQGRVAAVHVSHAIFTNLSRAHLDYHGNMAAYAIAKQRLFRMPGLRWAVLNHDDRLSSRIAGNLAPSVRIARYSIDPDMGPGECLEGRCDLWVHARAVEPLPRGLRLVLATSLGEGELTSNVIGRFNASNLMAVLALLLARGTTLDQALRRLAGVRGVPGRMECFGGNDGPLTVVDYAHTPDALEKAVAHLRLHSHGRLITVFGCGGNRDADKRPRMGAIAERLSDQVIVTDDNPRGEDGDRICAQILAGMTRPERVVVERQRGLAIRRALALAGRGDAVLIAGKGHETVQDMGELKVHFSDRAQVVQALNEWTGKDVGGRAA